MHVRRAVAADLPDFAKVSSISMYNDEVIEYTSPNRAKYPESYVRHFLMRAKRRFYSGQWLFVAVTDAEDPEWDGKERIIGYSCFSTTLKNIEKPKPGGPFWNDVELLALKVQEYHSWLFHLDRSADVQHETNFRSTGATDTTFDHIPDVWELELLGVHPDFQRRGIGRKLLQWGFDRAAESQVPLILVASTEGEKMYLRLGFREINRLQLKDEGYVFKGGAAMIWEPDSSHKIQTSL